MAEFYAEKLWQKAKEQWLIDESTENYEKILSAFIYGVNHLPEGYVLVPVEPTEAMIDAWWDTHVSGKTLDEVKAYKAMIQAAQEEK